MEPPNNTAPPPTTDRFTDINSQSLEWLLQPQLQPQHTQTQQTQAKQHPLHTHHQTQQQQGSLSTCIDPILMDILGVIPPAMHTPATELNTTLAAASEAPLADDDALPSIPDDPAPAASLQPPSHAMLAALPLNSLDSLPNGAEGPFCWLDPPGRTQTSAGEEVFCSGERWVCVKRVLIIGVRIWPWEPYLQSVLLLSLSMNHSPHTAPLHTGYPPPTHHPNSDLSLLRLSLGEDLGSVGLMVGESLLQSCLPV